MLTAEAACQKSTVYHSPRAWPETRTVARAHWVRSPVTVLAGTRGPTRRWTLTEVCRAGDRIRVCRTVTGANHNRVRRKGDIYPQACHAGQDHADESPVTMPARKQDALPCGAGDSEAPASPRRVGRQEEPRQPRPHLLPRFRRLHGSHTARSTLQNRARWGAANKEPSAVGGDRTIASRRCKRLW